MNGLTRFLLDNILEQESNIVAFYGGEFKPPTKSHFLAVKKFLEENPDIDKFNVVIGRDLYNNISQDEAYSVWNIYKKYLDDKVELILSDSSPLNYIKEYAQNNDHKIFILFDNIDEENPLNDSKNSFSKLGDNIVTKDIISTGRLSSKNAQQAALVSKDQFYQYLPDILNTEEIDTIYDYIKTPLQELAAKEKAKKLVQSTKSKLIEFIKALKEEGGETLEAFNLIVNSIKDDQKLTPQEVSQITSQLGDILKTIGLTAASVLPGGAIYLALTKVPFLKNYLLPSAFKKDESNVLENIDPKSQSKHKGKSSPFGSAYTKVEETGLETAKKNMDDYKKSNNPSGKKPKDPFGLNQFAREIMQEEESFDTFDYPKHLKDLTKFMLDQGLNLKPLPSVKFINDDVENANNHLKGKTAYYDPNHNRIVLYTLNRHPKDVMRSFAHEMIHHLQNCEDRLGNITTQDINQDDHLKQIESEAYDRGNYYFRTYTNICEGLLAEGRYDKLTNQISSQIFNKWKSDIDLTTPSDEEQTSQHKFTVNEPNLNFDIDAILTLEPGIDELETLDTTGAGTDKKGDFINVHLRIDPDMLPQYWGGISMLLKDIVRHEIEHLTHNIGAKSSIKSKELEDDLVIRALIKAKLIPQGEYWKLPKEVDASLQGMYFRAKKIRKPLKLVVNNYLDSQDITPEEKQEILQLWDKRAKELNLPNVI